jgi:Fic family protein
MTNTWKPEITAAALWELRRVYARYENDHPHSAVLQRYRDDFRASFVYNSNAIEGSPVTENDTAYLLNAGTFLETYTARENMEVLGGGYAWKYICTLPALDLSAVQNIHQRVLFFDPENAGVIRTADVYIGAKQMPPAPEVQPALLSLLELDDSDLFEHIAHFHLRFENIHPFIDGNGRTGRMIINLQLMRAGFAPVNFKLRDVGKYYRCFRQYDISPQKGIQELYNLLTQFAHEELTRLIDTVTRGTPPR